MALNPVPQAGQTLVQTRDPINQNFASIDATFKIDHIEYNTTGAGFHRKLTMPAQSSIPPRVAGSILMYSQTSAITSQPELVFARQAGSTAPAAVQVTEFTSAGWASPGWCRLPSGILMIWASVSTGNSADGNYTIPFPGAGGFPRFTAVYNIQITPTYTSLQTGQDPKSAYYAGPITIGNPGSFQVRQQLRSSTGTPFQTFNYFAIGI